MQGLTEELHKLGTMIIAKTLEHMDHDLCKSSKRKENWNVEKHVSKNLVTSLGNVTFNKTLFCKFVTLLEVKQTKNSGMKYMLIWMLFMI